MTRRMHQTLLGVAREVSLLEQIRKSPDSLRSGIIENLDDDNDDTIPINIMPGGNTNFACLFFKLRTMHP
ncbi:hypothetical protein JW979_15775 [bacterium]|nr:hypothetical protein [candidate division CSSED10-310 bacterium]